MSFIATASCPETDADNPITEYRDTDVDEGDTYEYTLRVFHYRAEGPYEPESAHYATVD